ncbi:MAG: winged helix-turn-helix domain-containing tetratricopeptide repeat protein [Halofilum sp. (in: g-proteobacteria)]|nr:winged helix-turn-helix domain-containing tetratricopeptide repeat protein [Halofilum sp. (in: g-proteobacteria)]
MSEESQRHPGSLTDPFRVAEWEVDIASHRIRRGEETVKLEPRTMALLVYLASRAGQVVTREELEREVWSGRVVGYEALSNTIAKLRRAFDDHPREPQFVETVPKAGYRLVAEVENISTPAQSELPDSRDSHSPEIVEGAAEERSLAGQGRSPRPEPTTPGKSPRGTLTARRLLVAGALVLALLAAAATAWQAQREQSESEGLTPATSGKPSVAVLPFDNLSPDPAQDFFADGLTSDLITDLSGISGLFVIARHSVFAYEDPARPVTEIADELGVRFVVDGSVQRASGHIRINAQLIDGSTGLNLWSERYEGDEMEVFALQDEVIRDIVSSLAVALTDAERTRLARRSTDNLEAYDYYLRAEHRWLACVEVGCEGEVIALYREAIALDPEFVDAYAGLAEAAWATWRWDSSNIMPGAAARRLAFDAASKVLSLDESDPRAYTVLAAIQAIELRHRQAVQSARRAVSLAPNSFDAHVTLAWILTLTGDLGEAQSEMETALRLNPGAPDWYHAELGIIKFFRRDYETAIALLSPADEYFKYQLWIAMTYAQLGRKEKARTEIEPIYEEVPFANQAWFRTLFAHFDRDEDLEHMMAALEKAGVPEWPFGFEPARAERLDESELRRITVGRTWTGNDFRGNRFIQQFTNDGRVAFRGHSSLLTGSFDLRDNLLCVQYPGTLLGREDCGQVYRNPDGTPEQRNQYVRVSIGDIYYFSLGDSEP